MKSQGQLGELLVFVAVVEAGSFVGAGRAMGITGSAASKAVQRMERRLGVKLLYRSSRSLSLTDEGQRFYEGCQRVLKELEAAEASVQTEQGEPRGTLRVTVPDALGRHVLLPLVAEFMREWPAVNVEMNFSDMHVDMIAEGFDLAIRIGSAGASDGVIARKIASYPVFVCASPGYCEVAGIPKHASDLANHTALIFRSNRKSQPWHYTDANGARMQVPVGSSRLAVDSGEALRAAAVAGLGLAYLPEFLVAQDIRAGALQQVLADVDFGCAPIYALYPDKRFLEPRVRQFLDLLASALGNS